MGMRQKMYLSMIQMPSTSPRYSASVSYSNTDAEYLGEVLKSEKLVDGEDGEFGMFITTADGEQADDSKQQWWCITKAGEQVNTSADQTPVADGDEFELTLKEGY